MAPSAPPPRASNVSHRSRTSSVHVFNDAHVSADVESDYGLRAKAHKWWGKQQAEFKEKRKSYTPLDWAACVLPCISWVKRYSVRFRTCLLVAECVRCSSSHCSLGL